MLRRLPPGRSFGGFVYRRLHGLQPQLGGGFSWRRRSATNTSSARCSAVCRSNVIPVEEHLNQFTECLMGGVWGGYFADSQVWANSFSYFNPSQDWLGKMYLEIIPNVYSNWLSLQAATKDEAILAVGQIVKAAAFQRVTDTYGADPLQPDRFGREGYGSAGYPAGGLRKDFRRAGCCGCHADGTSHLVDLGGCRPRSTPEISKNGSSSPIRSSCGWPCGWSMRLLRRPSNEPKRPWIQRTENWV